MTAQVILRLDEISLDDAEQCRIEIRLAEFVTAVTECSGKRALALVRRSSAEKPFDRLAIALAIALAATCTDLEPFA